MKPLNWITCVVNAQKLGIVHPAKMSDLYRALKDIYQRWRWLELPFSNPIAEFDLGNSGGASLLVADINDDGVNEFLWLQSAGIFKSTLFSEDSKFPEYGHPSYEPSLYCLTATDLEGRILWQDGSPFSGEGISYLSHAADYMTCCGDIDGDGRAEVLVLDGTDGLRVLDGATGILRERIKLPSDNFATLKCSLLSGAKNRARVLIGNSDVGYPPHDYANPWLFMDGELKILRSGDYLGAGHNVDIIPSNSDRGEEFLIGYQLVDRNGDITWTLDYWQERQLDNPVMQHSDGTAIVSVGERWFVAIAGSDRLYFADSNGSCLWDRKLPHPQFVVALGAEDQTRLIVLNQRQEMNCFDIYGNMIWQKLFPEHWPSGRPTASKKVRPIHINQPAVPIRKRGIPAALVYLEGGWPYVVNHNGEPSARFRPPEPEFFGDTRSDLRRINDHGLAFEATVADIDQDGDDEVILFNRSRAWIYRP